MQNVIARTPTPTFAFLRRNQRGVSFDMSHIYASGNVVADMYCNVAAYSTGRVLAARLYNATADTGMKDMLSFQIARDFMAQLLAVLEELGGQEAPGDEMLAIDRLMRGSASVQARKQVSYRQQEEALLAALKERWPEPAREMRLRVIAMVAVGATRLASETSNQEGGGGARASARCSAAASTRSSPSSPPRAVIRRDGASSRHGSRLESARSEHNDALVPQSRSFSVAAALLESGRPFIDRANGS